MMRIVKLFPDYCSSGLWDENGANMDESELGGVLTTVDFIALRYWHEAWEFSISDSVMSDTYIERWNKDGQDMVDAWNEKQSAVKFVYVS